MKLYFYYTLSSVPSAETKLELEVDTKMLKALAESVATYIQEIYEDELEDILAEEENPQFDLSFEEHLEVYEHFDQNWAVDHGQSYGPIKTFLMENCALVKTWFEAGEELTIEEMFEHQGWEISIDPMPNKVWKEVFKRLKK